MTSRRCQLCSCETPSLNRSRAALPRTLWLCDECHDDELCVRCEMPTTSGIYIRAQRHGEPPGSHQCCVDCFEKEHPGRAPAHTRGFIDVN